MVNGPPIINPAALVDLIASDPAALARLRTLVEPAPASGAGPYMTPDEAAEYLRCTRKRVYDLVGSRRLARYGEGRRLLLRRADVEALAAADGR